MGCSFKSRLITGESFGFDLFSWENEQNPESPWSILVPEYWAALPHTALKGETASMSVYRRKTQRFLRWRRRREKSAEGFWLNEKNATKVGHFIDLSKSNEEHQWVTVYAETCCSVLMLGGGVLLYPTGFIIIIDFIHIYFTL